MNTNNNTIFDLQQSKNDSKFIETNANIELEIGVDILETAKNIPYIGSIIKIGQIALNYIDYRFFKKLGNFLKHANKIPKTKLSKFLENISLKDQKRISDYLTQLLYTADEDEKADLMGKIYVRAVQGEIDIDTMLRLCSIVNRAYISDLSYLKNFLQTSSTNTYITDNLISLGLLADSGNLYEIYGDGWDSTGFGPTKHTLNVIGLTLYQIMTEQPIVKKHIDRIIDNNVPFRPMTDEEILEIINNENKQLKKMSKN